MKFSNTILSFLSRPLSPSSRGINILGNNYTYGTGSASSQGKSCTNRFKDVDEHIRIGRILFHREQLRIIREFENQNQFACKIDMDKFLKSLKPKFPKYIPQYQEL
jgi:hypothetical protein